MEEFMKNYERWLASNKLGESERAELEALRGNEDEIKERFSSLLSFGTAGLRGTMAMGMHNMNIYTVTQATQGFAAYIRACGEDAVKRGVVVGCDSRHNSRRFSRATAAVMANNGIKVYLFASIQPTPELSFAVRRLGATAGVNITASHNPKQYNGYKAYWADGAQLGPEQADAVSAEIAKTDIFDGVLYAEGDFERALESGMIELLGDETDEAFLEQVLRQPINPSVVAEAADELRVVYTPLYGTGYKLVPEAMRRLGMKHIVTVDEQMTPCGDFSTTPFPNPELPEVFEHAIRLANECGADFIIGNDPDADRTGVMIRGADGQFITLTGNQIGAMLLDYIITASRECGRLSEHAFAVKTIVSTDMVTEICRRNGVQLYDVLTGFKFIGKVVSDYEERTGRSADEDFLLGFEESNGYARGTFLRDKDAVTATVLLCEMAAYYHTKGKTVYQALLDMYDRYGLYVERTSNVYMEGIDGTERMRALMERLRSKPPKTVGGSEVIGIRDYLTGKAVELRTGAESGTGCPESNVLYYILEGDNKVVIRPSGTEPKIKIYYLFHTESGDMAALDALVDSARESMKEITGI